MRGGTDGGYGYRTRSANVKGCSGRDARRATWSLSMLVDAGGCDHGWFLGNWCVAVARHLDRSFNGQMMRMRRESRIVGLAGIVCWLLLTLDGGWDVLRNGGAGLASTRSERAANQS